MIPKRWDVYQNIFLHIQLKKGFVKKIVYQHTRSENTEVNMKKTLWIGLIIFVVSLWGLFCSESLEEELRYRSPESRYAIAMPTQDIVDELYMSIMEIEKVHNDKEKLREISEDIIFYMSVLEHKGEVIPNYLVD